MNLDIAHLGLALQDLAPGVGARVAELLGPALQGRLSSLGPPGGAATRYLPHNIAHLDLGVIEAPAGADPHILSELIAAQLVGWIEREGR